MLRPVEPMRIPKAIHDKAAALVSALLLIACPVAGNAQTVSNTAYAHWLDGHTTRTTMSNTVDIAVVPSKMSLATYHPITDGAASLTVQPSTCNGTPLPLFSTNTGGAATVAASATTDLHIGEILIVSVSAPIANVDPGVVDSMTATITTPGGDKEVLKVFETGPDTGIFTGAIRTRSIPPGKVVGDCQLSVKAGEKITVAIGNGSSSTPLITTLVGVLSDPFGFVVDSETGEPVSGARVTLINEETGLPATVFAEDGVTLWPSSVITGQPITDAAGTVHQTAPGEYRFPLAPLGNYRLVVEPPAPYTAPTEILPEILRGMTRPTGEPLMIVDASFGKPFHLSSPAPLQVDIPVDWPNMAAAVTKTASRATAQPGDAVLYTVNLRNQDGSRQKSNVTLVDIPSEFLRLRPESIRIDGSVPATGTVTVAPDGSQLSIAVPTITAGAVTKITYAMTVRADAPAGQVINRAIASDIRGGRAIAEAAVKVERDNIASRMTIVGRITAGDCSVLRDRPGIPGVRVMLEDGSFAITDRDGRYHFEGVVPGTHVVQVQRQTLPQGGKFVDCDRSTRSAGNPISRFVMGQGGSLAVADFTADVPGWAPPVEQAQTADSRAPATAETTPSPSLLQTDQQAAGADKDWLAQGDGPTDFLFPEIGHNPRAPAIRVVIRHRASQTVDLMANGKPVDSRALDGTKVSPDGTYAVTVWRGIPLGQDATHLTAIVKGGDGATVTELNRDVAFVSAPWDAEIVPERSHLVADGKSRPVIAVRLTDRQGRPVRSGVSGSVTLNAPYQSAAMLDRMQLQQLTGQGSASPNWVIDGDDGIALIELAPTMVSGPLHLSFNFTDRELSRQRELDDWVVPGDLDWTVIGLAEGSVGAKTVADNMERTGRFDSDLGDNGRVALYAKGRVLGRFLLTLAYDSAKQKDDQRLLGTIDPNAYYTVYADGSDRQFDAASREKLYLRIETATFYALYGDFLTGFDQTILGRYQRTATGVKAEGRFGALHAQGFAAKIATRYRHDEIQGNGLTGPYRLSDRNIVANSETVAIEVRDRLRSEKIIERHELTRYIDYDIDVLSGTISFKEPVLSRDFDLNPQFIVIDYEVDQNGGAAPLNAGVRADYTLGGDTLRIGVTGLTDKGDGARTDLGAIDLRARFNGTTELRAEFGMSRTDGTDSSAWLVEAEHRTGAIDVLAYARSLDNAYGTGQQTGAELGRRKFGVDARYAVTQRFSVTGSAWYDESLTDSSSRRAAQITAGYRTDKGEIRLGVAHMADTLVDGTQAKSTVLEGALSHRLLNNKLELSASTSLALDKTESIDLPTRHRLLARYALTDWLRLVGSYEIADGDSIRARTFNGGVEVSPWRGARILGTLGKQDIAEQGKRTYAAFGLAQNLPVSKSLSLDVTLDGNRTLSGGNVAKLVNPAYPASSGGTISQNGAQFEDFTAVTLGASWRKEQWAATTRGEYRDAESSTRKGLTAAVLRQLGDGVVVGSGLTWTTAESFGDAKTEVMDAAVSFAYRPAESEVAMLGKLEYRSDMVANAVAGDAGPAGTTALTVTGNARSQRLIASLSTNWSPHEDDDGKLVRRTEVALFTAVRYNFDRLDGFDLGSTTVLGGLDARFGLGDRLSIGGSATVRTSFDDAGTSFAFGPQVGFVPAKDTLISVGYNISGFRDPDFSAARNTDKGFYASVRMKFDADSFAFLGLGRK